MKIIFYIIIIITTAVVATYYVKPDLFKSIQNSVTKKVTNIIPIDSLKNETTIYKWKNDKGELQISNSPPEKGIKYHKEQVKHSINVMPSKAISGKTSDK